MINSYRITDFLMRCKLHLRISMIYQMWIHKLSWFSLKIPNFTELLKPITNREYNSTYPIGMIIDAFRIGLVFLLSKDLWYNVLLVSSSALCKFARFPKKPEGTTVHSTPHQLSVTNSKYRSFCSRAFLYLEYEFILQLCKHVYNCMYKIFQKL